MTTMCAKPTVLTVGWGVGLSQQAHRIKDSGLSKQKERSNSQNEDD